MSELFRYGVAGFINAAVSYSLYAGLVLIMPYSIAFSIAYIAGMLVSYYLNAHFVFRTPVRFKTAVRYPLVYIAQYIANIILLHMLIERIGINKFFAPLIAAIVTVPLTFILSRRIIK